MAESSAAPPTLVVLGGYGNAGRSIARLLLTQSSARVVLAGRSLEKARAAAQEMNAALGEERAGAARVDAADAASLRAALSGAEMVVSAASTARYTHTVAEAALECGSDYLDIQFSAAKVRTLRSLAPRILKEGRCFITEGGFHPGLPAALVRYASPMLERLDWVRVGGFVSIDWNRGFSRETSVEFVEELRDYRPVVFRAGEWRRAGYRDGVTLDFGEPFGPRQCLPLALEEMRALPEVLPGLREAGFYMAGFDSVVDRAVLPLVAAVLRVAPNRGLKPMARVLGEALRRRSRPPYGAVLRLEAGGERGGRRAEVKMLVSHPDAYEMTAVPVVACLLQYLDGSARRPGLSLMAHLVDPERLVADMSRLGLRVSVMGKSGPGAAPGPA